MPESLVTLQIEHQAPPKPRLGEPCNGCGVCCLMEPCPLGVLVSGRRTGACNALRWQGDSGIYRCGAITDPQAVLLGRLPRLAPAAVVALAWLLQRLARRWIAAGIGCDCDAQINPQRVPSHLSWRETTGNSNSND